MIAPLTKADLLYPLTLYFQGEPAQEIQRFHVESATDCMQRLGMEFSDDYSEILNSAYLKTLRREMGF